MPTTPTCQTGNTGAASGPAPTGLLKRCRRAALAALLLAAGMGAGAQTAPVRTTAEPAGALPASGFVLITPDGQAHVHLSRALAAGERLWVQWPGRAGQPGCCRRLAMDALQPVSASEQNAVDDKQEHSEERPVLMALDGSTPVHYRLRVAEPDSLAGNGFVGMALAAPRVHAQGAHALRAAPDVHVRMCAGAEGLNLLTQAGQRRQVLYLSLGYPIESRHPCTPQDEDFIRRASQ
ncbi:hypothetical protein EBQ34_00855 [Vandammella animalimorsus]|uniref:Uncharacterized protein n=1 Tax=Vandammella animalimorsus TaxID=2029117 RepID=A0A3M6RV68_9BURK|nr:hypothetical protein [Vandammella animalimorsus]RMX18938.1 hypothetical protein EBQ34_00855 [Vandammella animalimorsus]